MAKFVCPRCSSDYTTRVTESGRKFIECSNNECTFNYKNLSKPLLGKNRRHFKLTQEDYVTLHEMAEEHTIGYLKKFWGISRKQVTRILKLNLSRYAERIYGEKPKDLNTSK